jgi:hypothetical protein
MFEPSDFEISIEKELRLRMVNDEINHCDDIDELRKQLINVTRLFTQYQHLLEVAVKQLMVQDGYPQLIPDKIEVTKEQ